MKNFLFQANETILEKMDEDLRKDSDVSLIEPPLLIEEMEVVLAEETPSEEVQIAKPSCHQKPPSKNVLKGKKNIPGCSRNKVTNWADCNPYETSPSKKLRPVMQSSLGDAEENYYKVMAETMKHELELKKNKDVREQEIHELEKEKRILKLNC
ncbi:uncharacterized protein isoform X2 [Leptinotarsa decemlineata]|uniref:uncharacterized protein isoform X2 n=2 Tax=Leptinotarsa decemlineata TaxID=7539 RepID=UPI003D30A0BC